MHLEVTFRNLRPREEIRKRAQALFAKLEHFFEESTEAILAVGLDHGVTRTELTITSRGQTFQAHDEDEDLRTALDRTFHTIETSLRRAKEKRIDRKRRAGAPPVDGFAPLSEEEEEETGLSVA